jgi:hypothetical protein
VLALKKTDNMNSIDTTPTKDERVIYGTRCHWAVFLGPMLVIIIGGLALRSQGLSAAVLVAFGFLWGTFAYVSFYGSELSLTPVRLLIKAGLPRLKFYDIPIDRIVSIDYYQPTLGAMLNFGKIMIVYGEKSRCIVRFVWSPAEFVTRVREQIASLNPR